MFKTTNTLLQTRRFVNHRALDFAFANPDVVIDILRSGWRDSAVSLGISEPIYRVTLTSYTEIPSQDVNACSVCVETFPLIIQDERNIGPDDIMDFLTVVHFALPNRKIPIALCGDRGTIDVLSSVIKGRSSERFRREVFALRSRTGLPDRGDE